MVVTQEMNVATEMIEGIEKIGDAMTEADTEKDTMKIDTSKNMTIDKRAVVVTSTDVEVVVTMTEEVLTTIDVVGVDIMVAIIVVEAIMVVVDVTMVVEA